MDDKTLDRAIGTFIGLAIGDAVGTTLEFGERDARRIDDMVGGGPFELKAGEWTDDTSMALCLAESLQKNPEFDERDLMNRFINWWLWGENSTAGRCFDIGITTRDALARYEWDGNPIAGSTDHSTSGNGSLVRLAPVAVRWFRHPKKAVSVARRQSATTHGSASCLDGCAFLTGVLVDTICTGSREVALQSRNGYRDPDVARVAWGSWRRSRHEIRSTGYVIETLEAAMWAVEGARDFRDAILRAVNLAGDADTVGAVAGQIAGAIWGVSEIPKHWLDRLAWRDQIEALARNLAIAGAAH